MTYIEVKITQTYKRWGSKDRFTRNYPDEVTKFPSMKEARKFLASRYGKKRREPMYCDLKDGRTVQSGYVYHYSEDHYREGKWIYNDWVSIHEVHTSFPLSGMDGYAVGSVRPAKVTGE